MKLAAFSLAILGALSASTVAAPILEQAASPNATITAESIKPSQSIVDPAMSSTTANASISILYPGETNVPAAAQAADMTTSDAVSLTSLSPMLIMSAVMAASSFSYWA